MIGGPQGDTGLTGRKIIVDTYGGMGRHGGGAFSGKDATKVDRSAAYMGRWVAKNIVAAEARRALRGAVRLRHRLPDPVSVHIDTFGTATVPDAKIVRAVNRVFSFQPAEIIDQLNLRRPIYSQDDQLRPLRQEGHDLGSDRQGQGAAEGARAIEAGPGARVPPISQWPCSPP